MDVFVPLSACVCVCGYQRTSSVTAAATSSDIIRELRKNVTANQKVDFRQVANEQIPSGRGYLMS